MAVFNKYSFFAFCAAFALTTARGIACTDVVIHNGDRTVVSGRTMDFAIETEGNLIAKAHDTDVKDELLVATDAKVKPLTWKVKYASVLVGVCEMPCYPDGLNAAGLSVSALWQFGAEPAQTVISGTSAIASPTLSEYLLENAATVAEAKELVKKLSIFGMTDPKRKLRVELHWIVTDKTGKSVVIELKGGKPRFFDDASEINVLTNQPDYEQQVTSFKRYTYLTPVNRKDDVLEGQFVNGSGALGLPGDYTPGSRFVKTAFLAKYLTPVKSAQDGVNAVLHILHNVEVPRGAIAEGMYTQWTVVQDHDNLRYYFESYNHPKLKYVDLKILDFRKAVGHRIAIDYDAEGDLTNLLTRPK